MEEDRPERASKVRKQYDSMLKSITRYNNNQFKHHPVNYPWKQKPSNPSFPKRWERECQGIFKKSWYFEVFIRYDF